MKCPIVWLPSLLVLAFAAAIAMEHPHASTSRAGNGETEIRELRQERRAITERLNKLEEMQRHVAPRGIS